MKKIGLKTSSERIEMTPQSAAFVQKMNHHAAALAEMEAALWKAVAILGAEFVARAVCADTWPRKIPATQ